MEEPQYLLFQPLHLLFQQLYLLFQLLYLLSQPLYLPLQPLYLPLLSGRSVKVPTLNYTGCNRLQPLHRLLLDVKVPTSRVNHVA
jgi:hypothetical protein